MQVDSLPVLILLNKNQELQKIYCGVSKLQLKEKQEKRHSEKTATHQSKVKTIKDKSFADFGQFMQLKPLTKQAKAVDARMAEL